MNVVDSSAWIEYFIGGPKASAVEPHIADPSTTIAPSLVLYEVYKKVKRDRSEEEALQAAAQIGRGRVIPLDDLLALAAADLSLACGLALADSVVLATARHCGVKVVTLDPDFRGLPDAVIL